MDEDGRVVDVRARDVRISFGVDVLRVCGWLVVAWGELVRSRWKGRGRV